MTSRDKQEPPIKHILDPIRDILFGQCMPHYSMFVNYARQSLYFTINQVRSATEQKLINISSSFSKGTRV